jgi:hypothetical protein
MAIAEGGYLIPSEITESVLKYFKAQAPILTSFFKEIVDTNHNVFEFELSSDNTELNLTVFPAKTNKRHTRKVFITEEVATKIKTSAEYRNNVAKDYLNLVKNVE